MDNPLVGRNGEAVLSNGVWRWQDTTGDYYAECPRCGRQWGPHSGRCVGFVLSGIYAHIAVCGKDDPSGPTISLPSGHIVEVIKPTE